MPPSDVRRTIPSLPTVHPSTRFRKDKPYKSYPVWSSEDARCLLDRSSRELFPRIRQPNRQPNRVHSPTSPRLLKVPHCSRSRSSTFLHHQWSEALFRSYPPPIPSSFASGLSTGAERITTRCLSAAPSMYFQRLVCVLNNLYDLLKANPTLSEYASKQVTIDWRGELAVPLLMTLTTRFPPSDLIDKSEYVIHNWPTAQLVISSAWRVCTDWGETIAEVLPAE